MYDYALDWAMCIIEKKDVYSILRNCIIFQIILDMNTCIYISLLVSVDVLFLSSCVIHWFLTWINISSDYLFMLHVSWKALYHFFMSLGVFVWVFCPSPPFFTRMSKFYKLCGKMKCSIIYLFLDFSSFIL